jgi:hypothetical protein
MVYNQVKVSSELAAILELDVEKIYQKMDIYRFMYHYISKNGLQSEYNKSNIRPNKQFVLKHFIVLQKIMLEKAAQNVHENGGFRIFHENKKQTGRLVDP